MRHPCIIGRRKLSLVLQEKTFVIALIEKEREMFHNFMILFSPKNRN